MLRKDSITEKAAADKQRTRGSGMLPPDFNFWLGWLDSNQRSRIQSPPPCQLGYTPIPEPRNYILTWGKDVKELCYVPFILNWFIIIMILKNKYFNDQHSSQGEWPNVDY